MADDHQTPVRIIIKKKKGHAGHHGGAWKVAYADFVTAMMAFFIVMWIMGQSDQVKQSVSSYFKEPGEFSFITGKKTIPVDLQMAPAGTGEGEGKNKKEGKFTGRHGSPCLSVCYAEVRCSLTRFSSTPCPAHKRYAHIDGVPARE